MVEVSSWVGGENRFINRRVEGEWGERGEDEGKGASTVDHLITLLWSADQMVTKEAAAWALLAAVPGLAGDEDSAGVEEVVGGGEGGGRGLRGKGGEVGKGNEEKEGKEELGVEGSKPQHTARCSLCSFCTRLSQPDAIDAKPTNRFIFQAPAGGKPEAPSDMKAQISKIIAADPNADSITMKIMRERLSTHYGIDMTPHKTRIKELVNEVLKEDMAEETKKRTCQVKRSERWPLALNNKRGERCNHCSHPSSSPSSPSASSSLSSSSSSFSSSSSSSSSASSASSSYSSPVPPPHGKTVKAVNDIKLDIAFRVLGLRGVRKEFMPFVERSFEQLPHIGDQDVWGGYM